MTRFLNGFILIGITLLFISLAGLVKGATLLSEPGTPPNPYAWLEYFGAAVLMFINGAVSIHLYRQRQAEEAARRKKEQKSDTEAPGKDAGEEARSTT